MLTAHQRVAITAHLPEVVQADVREGRGDVVDFVFVRLELASGSKIAIYGLSEDGS